MASLILHNEMPGVSPACEIDFVSAAPQRRQTQTPIFEGLGRLDPGYPAQSGNPERENQNIANAVSRCVGIPITVYTYRCRISVVLSPEDMTEILKAFAQPPQTAADERLALADAVARFETCLGAKAGTSLDVGGWPGNRLLAIDGAHQQNCVQDYQTVRQFLFYLQQAEILHHHQFLGDCDSVVINHKAALLQDSENQKWVLDSWLRNNGEVPPILPYDAWVQNRFGSSFL